MSAETIPAADLVTVNIGNSHTTAMAWNFRNETSETLELQSDFRSMYSIAKFACAAPEIVVASVVKQCARKLLNDLLALERQPIFLRIDLEPQIEIVPQPAERVGDDRIAAALGALSLDGTRAWIVVDAGTAVTCNAVTPGRDGRLPRFEGGLIFPGAALCLQSLNQGTAQLPDLTSAPIKNSVFDFIGRNTEQAMLYGALAMQSAAILSMIEGQQAMLGGDARVALTGGGAGFLVEALKRSGGAKYNIVYEPGLVHLGLLAAWKAAR